MKTKIILTLLLILCGGLLKAQQTIKSHTQPDSIIRVIPIQTVENIDYAYTIGGRLVTRGEVVDKLKANAASAELYQRSKNSMTWGYVFVGAAAVSTTASVIAFRNSSKNTFATMGAIHNNSAGDILAGVATGFLASSIITWVHGLHLLKKSVNVYNQRFE